MWSCPERDRRASADHDLVAMVRLPRPRRRPAGSSTQSDPSTPEPRSPALVVKSAGRKPVDLLVVPRQLNVLPEGRLGLVRDSGEADQDRKAVERSLDERVVVLLAAS